MHAMSQEPVPSEATPAPAGDRREFLKSAACVALGGVCVLVPVAAGVTVLLGSVRRATPDGSWVELTKLDALKAPEPSESDPAEPAAAAENALIPLDRVPVGGGVILADQGIVLSRPTADSVLGFSAVCSHAGCSVAAIKGRNVVCPCHGSRFRLADGSVQAGPATRSLDAIGVRVEAGQVLRD